MGNLTAERGRRAAARATKKACDRILLEKVPRTQIAELTGYNRQTVAKYLEHTNDITLGMFLTAQALTGDDPIETLMESVREVNQESDKVAA